MTLSKMVRNLFRTQEILSIFFFHGFGDVVQRMGLSKYLKISHSKESAGDGEIGLKSSARRFREALEKAGGAFIKLGQLLSTRPDILPKRWIDELTPLQDEVAAVPYEAVERTIEDDLGPISERFAYIDPVPLAAGSIAQVHRGLTLNQENIVIKVRKPGVRRVILQDCDILEALAELLEKHVPESRNYRPVQLAEEFRNAIVGELDFTQEANNIDRFREDFKDHPNVVFPTVVWNLTTERVVTMKMIEGVKISLIEPHSEDGDLPERISHVLAEALLKQVLEFGFFHGDPHPGNLLVVNGQKVCFLDCGLVGRLDELTREHLLLLVSAGIRKDTRAMADILLEMNALPPDLDRPQFLREAYLFVEKYHRVPLKRLRMSSLVEDVMELIRKFGVQIPSDLVLVAKVIMYLESVGRKLDPDFDAVAVADPYIRRIVLESYGPAYVGRKVAQGTQEVLRLLTVLPNELREVLRTLRENRMKLVVEHRGLREPSRAMEQASRRLSLGLVIAALILGGSVVTVSPAKPLFLGLPMVSLIAFSLAGALGFWIMISAFRNND